MLRDRLMPFRSRCLVALSLGLGALAVLAFVFALCQRLPYPHELEWMEGAMVDHASRIANGLPLYCAPGPEHVPFLYAPLFFWIGGLVMALGGDGLLALRLVSALSSIGTALLIGHHVRRETRNVAFGLVAASLFVAGYGWLAWWYDLARNDALFVLLIVSCCHVLRHGGARRWILAAGLGTAAFLAKQTALMWLPAIAVGAAFLDWRLALRFVGATATGIGIAVGAMHFASDGWSTFWLFEMPRHHGWVGEQKLGFWIHHVPTIAPLLLLALLGFVADCRAGRWRTALFLAAFASGGLVASWLSLLHVGGFDNVLVYAFAGACVVGPIAAANARLATFVGPLLLVVQFVLLGHAAWQRGPLHTLLPQPAHRRAHDELLEFVQARSGPVWIPAHGGISARTGHGSFAHGQAIFDLLQVLPRAANGMFDIDALVDRRRLDALSPRAREAVTGFFDRTTAALRERRFAAIVVDQFAGADAFRYLFGSALDGYERSSSPLLREPPALRPPIGYDVHSPYALVPKR